MLTDEEISLVRGSASMSDICGMYGIKVTPAGFCGCPFHGKDKHPSMKVYPGDRGYHCFTCGEGGDVFTFVRKMSGIGFEDAVRMVAGYVGVPLPEPGAKRSREDVQKQREAAEKRRADRELAESIEETQKKLLIALSDEIRRLEDRREAINNPMSSYAAYLTAKIQKLDQQWEAEFERYGVKTK